MIAFSPRSEEPTEPSDEPAATPKRETTPPTRSRRWIIVAAIIAALLAAFAAWFLLLRDGAPVRATSTAAADVARSQIEDTASATDDLWAGFNGTFAVSDTFGSAPYPFEDRSYVGYRVDEEIAGFGAFTAVGRSIAVQGTMNITDDQVETVSITVDMSALTSDSGGRDDALETQALETVAFPTAGFELTTPIELTDVPADGETITLTATGELTLHGVTRAIDIELEATPIGPDTIVVVGSTTIEFEDYDIEEPTGPIVVGVEDHGEIELQLFFERSGN